MFIYKYTHMYTSIKKRCFDDKTKPGRSKAKLR